jgi:diguanylate cyclase (GGDEF)-like protein
VSAGSFINAALARGRYAGATTHALVLLLACFVTLQMAHHTGVSWTFVLPPLVLFLHPLRSGLTYLLGGVLIVTIGFTLTHVPLNLRDHEPFEFWASFFAVTGVSALVARDFGSTVKVVTMIAFRDPLTGLCQRDLFMELAEHHLEIARRKHAHCSVLAIDIDNMKAVNDYYGHAAGDEVLQALATLLTREMRHSDLIARFGGDEFVVLLSEQDDTQACEVAERLLERVRDGEDWQRWRACSPLSLSIGLAVFPAHGSSLGSLLEAADAALLRAKALGKQRICLAAGDI